VGWLPWQNRRIHRSGMVYFLTNTEAKKFSKRVDKIGYLHDLVRMERFR
jgi:hypothetical protein